MDVAVHPFVNGSTTCSYSDTSIAMDRSSTYRVSDSMRDKIFWVISSAGALYTGIGFICAAGWPPRVGDNWPLLVLFLLFFLVPFAKKLDIFQFLSFEAKVDEVKAKVEAADDSVKEAGASIRVLQQDVRHVLTQQQHLTASIQSQVHIHNHYTPAQLAIATQEVSDVLPTPTIVGQADIAEADDTMSATATVTEQIGQLTISPKERLVILRMKMEAELRRLLHRKAKLPTDRRDIKYLTSRSIVELALERFPDLESYEESFDVFFQVSNATAHGAEVPPSDVDQAINIGERLMTVLLKRDPV